MDYAATSANVRDRKLRPSNYDKKTKVVKNPPSGIQLGCSFALAAEKPFPYTKALYNATAVQNSICWQRRQRKGQPKSSRKL